MALAVAMGARPKELDLGRKQELVDLVYGWRLGMVWCLQRDHDPDVQAMEIEEVKQLAG